MSKVITFDTTEEMIKHIVEESVKRRGLPTYGFQEAMKVGDHYARVLQDENLIVFGEVIKSKYPEDNEMMANRPELRLVQAYSVACRDGEMGTEHIAHMIPLEADEFEFAKEQGWVGDGVMDMVSDALGKAMGQEAVAMKRN